MLAPNNLDTEIFAELEAAELDAAAAKDHLASEFMHRVRAGWGLREKAEILKQDKLFHAYLRELAGKLAAKGHPRYSIRWFQEVMLLAKHLPTEADAQPVAHLGMKENLRRIRNANKPKPRLATDDVVRDRVKVLLGDNRVRIKELPDETMDSGMGSPPFYRQRIYDGPLLVWDGDPACKKHDWKMHREKLHDAVTTEWSDRRYAEKDMWFEWGICRKCGAWLGQLGLEPTPELYIRHLIQIFREVRRVLKKTGTLWVNIGDTYEKGTGRLLWIPHRLALALDADGWIGRNEIIWHKVGGNTPESVCRNGGDDIGGNRCSRSHEQVLLFAKSKKYYFDAEAIKEPAVCANDPRKGKPILYDGKCQGEGGTGQRAFVSVYDTRNKRTVWDIPRQPTRFDHYAAYPEKLVEPMVLAGCPEGGTILDPFGGLATTGLKAQELGRYAVVIEVSPKYVAMAEDRLRKKPKAA